MKGIIMRSFVDFVEETYGPQLADIVLSLDDLSAKGAYTNVGYYPASDFVAMATAVSETTDTPFARLIFDFGRDLYLRLHQRHTEMLLTYSSPIEMLASLESVIHVEVRKLYTDTELPRFEVKARDANRSLTLLYRSSRPFADLAEGLIAGCLDQFGLADHSSVERHDVRTDGTEALFTVSVNEREVADQHERGTCPPSA
jgi:hypothetical protein